MSDEEQGETPFMEQVKALGGVYWVGNWIELVERFAYYGVRVVLPVFMVLAISDGGPELTHVQKGTIYGIWALVQSFIPIFSGGYADRFGYRITIAASTVLKIIGYLVMGYCIVMAEALAGTSLAEARPLGTDRTYEIFFAGAMLLALGTAIFKPGVQGLIATSMPTKSESLGWGIFYQCVNIGGFLGPLIAGYLRVLEWEYVFLTCAAAISLNFIPLFFFEDPELDNADERGTVFETAVDAVRGLLEPRLFFFTFAFAGFWLMFYQLFDILPNFIDDWIDTRSAAGALQSVLSWEGAVPTVNGGNLTQEWMINVNAGLISLLAFVVGFYTGKMRSLTAIVIGIAISAVGIFALGLSMNGWVIIAAICTFSVGEMMASPTKMRYLSALAPPGKKGQYMGYVNMTVGIGWSIGSIVAGQWYEEGGDKVNLARRYLTDTLHMPSAEVTAIDRAEVMNTFMQRASVDAWAARDLLWDTYSPGSMWVRFMAIGIGSLFCLIVYDRVLRKAQAEPDFSFNTRGRLWVRSAVLPIFAVLVIATIFQFQSSYDPDEGIWDAFMSTLALGANAVLVGTLAIASFVLPEPKTDPDEPKEF